MLKNVNFSGKSNFSSKRKEGVHIYTFSSTNLTNSSKRLTNIKIAVNVQKKIFAFYSLLRKSDQYHCIL